MHTNPPTRPPTTRYVLQPPDTSSSSPTYSPTVPLHQPCALSVVSTSDAAASTMMRLHRFHHPPTASMRSCMPCKPHAPLNTLMHHLHLHRTSWSVALTDTVSSPSDEVIPAELLCCIANDQRYTDKHPPEFPPSMVMFSSHNHQDRHVLKLALVSNNSITAGQCSVSDNIRPLWVYLTVFAGHSCQMSASVLPDSISVSGCVRNNTLIPNPRVPKNSS